MHSPPHKVSHSADSVYVLGAIEDFSILKVKPAALKDFCQDWFQGTITKLEWRQGICSGFVCHGHLSMVRGEKGLDHR